LPAWLLPNNGVVTLETGKKQQAFGNKWQATERGQPYPPFMTAAAPPDHFPCIEVVLL
jgi:hypothetical protein